MAEIGRASRARGNPPVTQIFTNASATGYSTGYNLEGTYSNFSIQGSISTATVGAAKVSLQRSLDGTNYTNITGSTWSSTDGNHTVKDVTSKATKYVRGVISTLTTGASSGTKQVNAYLAVW